MANHVNENNIVPVLQYTGISHRNVSYLRGATAKEMG